MTDTPLQRVIKVLAKAQYRRHTGTLVVASVPFEFSAIFIGTARNPDLIVVIDTLLESELRLRQKIESLARALDVAGSRRPLTVILVGPKPSDNTIDVLSRVCRVLPIGTPVGDGADLEIHDWLAVLLPLPLPDPSKALADPMGELTSALPAELNTDLKNAVLSAAEHGSSSVQTALRDELSRALAVVDTIAEDIP